MAFSRGAISCGIIAGFLSFVVPGRAESVTGYLYVSDYGIQALDRFSYTFDTVSKTVTNWQPAGANGSITNAVFINSNIKEGLQGTATDIIVVNSGGNSLSRYTLDGVLIGNIPILNANNTPHTLNSVGNVVITQDGKFMYAPESGAGLIDKIDLATGKIVAFVSFAGAHDVLIRPDGTLYAAAYTGNNPASAGIWHFDANLGSKTQLILNGDNGLGRPTGMSLSSSGILYVQANVFPTGSLVTGANSVYEYSIDSGTGAATFSQKHSYQNLEFDFGTDIGPDGNLYIAALGSGKPQASFGSPTGYTNGVYAYDTSLRVVSNVIAGYLNGTGTPASGFASPKYLEFGSNFITAPDAGFLEAPEPGSMALLGGLLAGGACLSVRRRRRAA
jgi:hypothetical protein